MIMYIFLVCCKIRSMKHGQTKQISGFTTLNKKSHCNKTGHYRPTINNAKALNERGIKTLNINASRAVRNLVLVSCVTSSEWRVILNPVEPLDGSLLIYCVSISGTERTLITPQLTVALFCSVPHQHNLQRVRPLFGRFDARKCPVVTKG